MVSNGRLSPVFGIKDERGYNQVFQRRGTTILRQQRRNQWLADQLRTGGARHAVEIGSGTGQTAHFVAKETGIDVLAVDISQLFVDEANGRYALPNLQFRKLDILEEDLPLARKTDAFFGNGILHHLIPRLDNVLERMRALTTEGGRLVFIEPNLSHPACRLIFGTRIGRRLAKLEPQEMAFIGEELADRVRRAGWSDVTITTRDFLLPGMPRLLERPTLSLEKEWESSAAARYLGQSHFVVAYAR
jgi:SAM-dependent methyltransferase